ncbi:MAG: hypothetical protein C4294_15470, partial [Nitrospiraceae bacterium]
ATPFIKPGLKTIDFWWGWGGMTGINALRATINRFNETSNTFQVNGLQVSGIGEKMLTAIAGGTAPDAAINGFYSEYWARGAALPL